MSASRCHLPPSLHCRAVQTPGYVPFSFLFCSYIAILMRLQRLPLHQGTRNHSLFFSLSSSPPLASSASTAINKAPGKWSNDPTNTASVSQAPAGSGPVRPRARHEDTAIHSRPQPTWSPSHHLSKPRADHPWFTFLGAPTTKPSRLPGCPVVLLEAARACTKYFRTRWARNTHAKSTPTSPR